MKKLLLIIPAIALTLAAQTASYVATITWVDGVNPAGTTYNVYKAANKTCAAAVPADFVSLTSGLTVKTYDDTVTPGNHCYDIRAVPAGGLEGPGRTAVAPVPAHQVESISISIRLQITQ